MKLKLRATSELGIERTFKCEATTPGELLIIVDQFLRSCLPLPEHLSFGLVNTQKPENENENDNDNDNDNGIEPEIRNN